MEPYILIPLIFSILFLLFDIIFFIRMAVLVKRYKDGTVEELGRKIMPYMYVTAVISVLMAISMILVVILR